MGSTPAWEQFVMWPTCSDCKNTGVSQEGKTGWPIECLTCKTRRENAVRKAQADLRARRTA